MDVAEFEKECAHPQLVYYLITDQGYVRNKVFELARSQVEEGARSFDWRVYDLENDSETGLIEECLTLPWMSPRRWVFVRNPQRAGAALLEYLARPSDRTVLILESSRKPAAWPPAPVIETERTNPVTWLRRKAKSEGFELPRNAAQTLVELVGDDFSRLESELEKLLLRHWDSRRIDRDSVLEMAFPTKDVDVFSLIGALAARRAEEGLSILGRLLEGGMTPPQILAILHWNFRRLLVAQEWLQAGRSFDQILGKLKIWSYRGKERRVREMSSRRLREMLLRLHGTDRLVKSTSLDERALIERFVIDTCRTRAV